MTFRMIIFIHCRCVDIEKLTESIGNIFNLLIFSESMKITPLIYQQVHCMLNNSVGSVPNKEKFYSVVLGNDPIGFY